MVTVFDLGERRNGVWVWRWNWNRELRGRHLNEFDNLLRWIDGKDPKMHEKDRWVWDFDDDGEFTVKRLKEMIDDKVLGEDGGFLETLWNKTVPRKVNIFMWRLRQEKLPVRVVLGRMGIDLILFFVHVVKIPLRQWNIALLDVSGFTKFGQKCLDGGTWRILIEVCQQIR